jgi:hypothetical protein
MTMDARQFPGRVARHLAWRMERATTITLDAMRRGDRTLIKTPPAGLRFGNWLYLWLDAHQRTARGERTVVLEAPGMDPWLEAFPALRGLTVAPDLVRFHDRRDWGEHSWAQRFGVDFTRESLNAFISESLAPYIHRNDSGTLVINVRRGDYYSSSGLQRLYGFDQLGYLSEALERIGPVDHTLIVSDDPQWCRENLLDLVKPVSRGVDFAERDPLSNFLAVSAASRIIGTNSTFTYWGAYIAGVLHDKPMIVMPRFHARLDEGPDAYQLDPRWVIVEGYAN